MPYSELAFTFLLWLRQSLSLPTCINKKYIRATCQTIESPISSLNSISLPSTQFLIFSPPAAFICQMIPFVAPGGMVSSLQSIAITDQWCTKEEGGGISMGGVPGRPK